MSFKTCPGCLKELSTASFYFNKSRHDKCSPYCMICSKERNQKPSIKAAKAQYHKLYSLKPASKLKQIQRGAAARGITFNLTEDQIPPLPTHCPILGFKFYAVPGDKDYSPSIDRIDNTEGYIPGNIQWISNRANHLKSNATMLEMRQLAEFYMSITGHVKPTSTKEISNMKICTSCHKLIPLTYFHKRHDSLDGHRSHCRDCVRERAAGRK